MLKHFLSAFALVLVFEGIMPFLYPEGWQKTLQRLREMSSQHLRVFGFFSMLIGVVMLYLVHG